MTLALVEVAKSTRIAVESKMNYFISQEIFNWHNMSSTQRYNGENIKECYDYLNHAESLIVDFKDKFHIQDAIRNLKIVVDKRIKQIERVYDFKSYFPKQDTVWYFLKSTDEMVYTANTGIELSEDDDIEDEAPWVGIDIDSPKMRDVQIRGKVNKGFLSKESFENAMEIENVEIKEVDEGKIYFSGNIILTKDIKILIAKKIFINRIPN